MIKYFRRIRYALMENGDPAKYLRYALGEIILVVLGILIALSINNWNQDRMLEREAVQYYQNIKRQLNEDVSFIQGNIDFNQWYLDQYQYAIELVERDVRSRMDTLSAVAMNLLEYSDFHQETNVYQSLVNSGEIRLLDNQEIIEGLQRLEELYIYMNKIEEAHFDVIKIIYPELNRIMQFQTRKVHLPDQLYSITFQNYFFTSCEIMREKDEVYHRALAGIHAILVQIDQELAKKG